MKINQKLLMGFISIALLVGIIGGIAIKDAAYIRKHLGSLSLKNIAEVEGATEVAYHIQKIKADIEEILLSNYMQDTDEVLYAEIEIEQSISEIRKAYSDWKNAIKEQIKYSEGITEEEEEEEEEEEVEKLKINYLLALINKTLRVNKKEGYQNAGEFYENKVEPLLRSVEKKVKELEENTEEEIEEEITERAGNAITITKNTTVFSSIITSVAVLTAIILGYLISRSIVSPIKKLERAVAKLGKGAISERVDITSKDEIGILANAFNQMSEDIETHINDRKQREELLKRQADILNLASDAIIIRDFDDRITYWNHAAEIQYGWTSRESAGQYPLELLHTVLPIPEDEIAATLLQKGLWEGELIQTARNGAQITVWSRYKLLTDEEGRTTGVLEINRDITEKKKAEETIRNLSLTDELTRIYNRRGFMIFTQQAMKIAERTKNIAIIFFADVDGLKWINDNLGHDHGDMVILDAANMLKSVFRESDIIARLGGDEFAVFTTGDASFNAETITTRLRQNIESHNKIENRQFILSMSVGMVKHDFAQPKSIDDLLSEADKLMYEQKRKKKEKMKTVDYRKVS